MSDARACWSWSVVNFFGVFLNRFERIVYTTHARLLGERDEFS